MILRAAWLLVISDPKNGKRGHETLATASAGQKQVRPRNIMALDIAGSSYPLRYAAARPGINFRKDIEGLRAVAVLAVVCFHYGLPGFLGGFVGVDIFFVISGYLITGLLIAELDEKGRIDLLRFYGRRVRRLLPAALLITIAIIISGMFVLSPLEQLATAKAGASSSLYISNFFFLHQPFDYFSPEIALNPFLHTWSLSVEEQFYIFWPALLLLVGNPKRHPSSQGIAIAAVTIVSFILCIWLTQTKQPWAFYSSPTRAWEFGLGGLASLAPVTRWVRNSRFAAPIGWCGALLLIISCLIINDTWRFPGPDALLPVGATACILISGSSDDWRGPISLLKTSPFQWLGARSYSIYLWHWPIIVFATIMVPFLSMWGRLACGALTLTCAAASYEILEKPIRRNRWLSRQAMRSIGLGAVLTLTSALAAIGAGAISKHLSLSQTQIMIDTVTGQLAPANSNGCLADLTVSKPVVCTFGTATPVRTIVLIGDSHADEWSTPVVSLAEQESWRVLTYMKALCSVADIPIYNMRLRRFSPECAEWRSQALAEIVRLRPDAVVIGQFSAGYVRGPLTIMGENAVALATWSEGLERTLRALDAAEIPTIVLRDTPTPGRNMRNCLAQADWRTLPISSCATPRSFALPATIAEAERGVAALFHKAYFIDLSSEFCSLTNCPAVRKDTIVYRDTNHITTAYAALLRGPLRDAMVPIVDAR